MKKFLLISLILFGTLVACADGWIKGSGKLDTAVRKLPAFTAVNVNSNCNVKIVQSNESKVVVIADDNIIGYVQTDVKKQELDIVLREGKYKNITKLQVTVYTPHLTLLKNSGTGNVAVEGVHESTFTLNSSGSGDIKVEDFCSDNSVFINAIGSGDVDIKKLSASSSVSVRSTGSGDVNIEVLMSDNEISMSHSGSGDIEVALCSTQKLLMDNKGSGDIEIEKLRGANDVAADAVSLSSLGSGDVEIGNLESANVSVAQQGSGDVKLAGVTDKLIADFNAIGDLKASSLMARIATVTQHGAGDVAVNVSQEVHLNKDSSAVGKFKLTGNAKVMSNE